jgi:HD-like signal output (HDOD) protein
MLRWLRRRPDDPRRQLEAALGDYTLPSFSAVILEALAALRDPEAALLDVGRTLLADPGASARLMQIVNSAAHGMRHPVRNVEHAVSLLGRAQVEAVLLAVGTSRAVSAEAPRGFDLEGFWRASAERAAVASALAARLHPRSRSECFTAALLSDMAVPLLARHRGDYPALLCEAARGGGDLHDLEREVFGWDHGFIAAALCERWSFPRALTDAIGGHHDEEEHPRLLPALALAACFDAVDGLERVVETGRARYGLPPDATEAAVAGAREHAQALARCFA